MAESTPRRANLVCGSMSFAGSRRALARCATHHAVISASLLALAVNATLPRRRSELVIEEFAHLPEPEEDLAEQKEGDAERDERGPPGERADAPAPLRLGVGFAIAGDLHRIRHEQGDGEREQGQGGAGRRPGAAEPGADEAFRDPALADRPPVVLQRDGLRDRGEAEA